MVTSIKAQQVTSSGSVQDVDVTLSGSNPNGSVQAAGVTAVETVNGALHTLVLTLVNAAVTLVKNGTSTGGGGTAIYNFPQGIIQPLGGSSNLTVANANDKSFLASVGSAAAGTDGTLTSTEISFLPSTAATTSTGAGTCKMKSTVTTPTPGGMLDGTSTPVVMYLNSCLNADATGSEALTYSGTIQISYLHHGDN